MLETFAFFRAVYGTKYMPWPRLHSRPGIKFSQPKINDELICVEDIQDSVEKILSQAGYADVAWVIFSILKGATEPSRFKT